MNSKPEEFEVPHENIGVRFQSVVKFVDPAEQCNSSERYFSLAEVINFR